MHAIVAARGAIPEPRLRHEPALSNPKLFARDRWICAYCGHRFHEQDLTREHIRADQPRRSRPLDELHHRLPRLQSPQGQPPARRVHMHPLYLPYVPSLHEDMILRGRRILADQMEFLLASVPQSSRLHG